MKVFITGGTGFVGSSLTRKLANKGHQVTVLDRTIKAEKEFPSTVSFIEADSTVRGSWQDIAAQHEIFINLAGASIFSRWNEKTKKAIPGRLTQLGFQFEFSTIHAALKDLLSK